jgi:hypothetical protein
MESGTDRIWIEARMNWWASGAFFLLAGVGFLISANDKHENASRLQLVFLRNIPI